MGTRARILCGALALGLLAGCGAPAAIPAPEASPDPLEAARPLLELAEGDEILDWVAGDLDGAGGEDLAVIADREEVSDGRRFGDVRELLVLTGTDGGYELRQSNREFLLRNQEGGKGGEPYRGASLDASGLHIAMEGTGYEYWALEYLLSWREGGLALTQVREGQYRGVDGVVAIFDFDRGIYAMVTDRMESCEKEEDFTPKTLYRTELEPGGPVRLDDLTDGWAFLDTVSLPPLPALVTPWYGEDHSGELRHTPEEMLDRIQAAWYPELARVDIPWTEATRANFSAAWGAPAPGHYYTDGTRVLSYYQLEVHVSDGGQTFFQHVLMCGWPEDAAFHWLWDDTGEEVFGPET